MRPTALVTGANGGIGSAIVARLLADGVRVVATDVASDTDHTPAANVTYVRLDLLAADSGFDPLFTPLGETGLDYLVNAAGMAFFDRDGSIFDSNDEEAWHMTMGVNLHALRRLTVAALPHLRNGRGRSIVNIASLAGLRTMDSPLDAYQASKAAVVSLSRSMAVQLAPEGIRCNTVCPGAVLTPMISPLYERSPERRSSMEQRTPLGRLGMPVDVANATAFLLSGDAGFITATELVVDGGWSAQLR
ncbi:SDR family NAD(P)-dependent oxidoreductase [Mycolicibacterium mageritense]|uniref:2-(R)-hydroxypropyl-CoM dehydrogenase n=1 Tax=Mycolicibacterium mageritense TaxID=53462 RepID=A0AAI8XNG5_MYCME|nr:SDR family oxidoreductase [Mycolicibacterium mageritense]BDY28872.1 2-(R)-hydroxypropyl-CoM dehydrogenase [Mycolicibacterium mageritense]